MHADEQRPDEQRPDHVPAPQTITKLTPQKKDPDRASVFLDGEFAFGVHQQLILEYDLHEGRALTLDEQKAITQADGVMKAKAAALDYIAYRPRTEQEVRQKLQKKEHSDIVADQVIERLYELGYLDDAAYAREYVRGRLASKGYGPVRLRQELKKRGVNDHLIEDALHDLLDEEDTLEAAREHARTKWDRLDPDEDVRKRRRKLTGYLRRRGFTFDTIRRVTDEVEQEAP